MYKYIKRGIDTYILIKYKYNLLSFFSVACMYMNFRADNLVLEYLLVPSLAELTSVSLSHHELL